MKKDFELKGIQGIMKKLNEAAGKFENRSMSGIIKAMVLVHRSMETNDPKIPVDLANLRHSFFYTTNRGPGKTGAAFQGPDAGKMSADHAAAVSRAGITAQSQRWPTGVMGFSANYAVYVHENTEADFARPIKIGGVLKKRRPGAGAKFFESALKREHANMLKVIHEEAKL